ncbi:MAG: pyridoxamine 5'-phosphate oxidase family protein [Pseudomonadota bacterium]
MTAELAAVAPAFVTMAHEIVWCTAATADAKGRPRSRVLHPIWEWDGAELTGWIATGPTPTKRAHLEAHPYLSCNYWTPSQDTCVAECDAQWCFDLPTRERVWKLFAEGPEPVGYDPSMIPGWDGPEVDAFAVLKLDPWRLRVFPGSVLLSGSGEVLVWQR